MANTKSNAVLGSEPMPSPVGSEVLNILLQVEVDAGDLGAGDLIILGEIPEDCVMVDAVHMADDLDSNGTPTVELEFGEINAAENDLATIYEAALSIGEAGGAARLTPTVANLSRVGGVSGTPIGYKVSTAAATGQAGTVGCSLSYRAVSHGE